MSPSIKNAASRRPVCRNRRLADRAVLDVRRALANRDHVADAAPSGRLSGDQRQSHRPVGAQASVETRSQRPAAGLEDRQVDRLVRYPHRRVVREVQHQPAADLLRRPLQLQALLHPARSIGLAASSDVFGRRARSNAASSAACARYRSRPPLRAISRLIVAGDRPRRAAMRRQDSPAASPRDTSSRSAAVR